MGDIRCGDLHDSWVLEQLVNTRRGCSYTSRVWRSPDTAGVAIICHWCLRVCVNACGLASCRSRRGPELSSSIDDRVDRDPLQVKIDGDFVTEQDGHADPDQFQQELFSSDDLDVGLHTVELTNLEQKFVDVDYVSVCVPLRG